MVALQAGTGLGGAARDFFDRHRIVVLALVLSVVGIATGASTATALLQDAAPMTAVVLGAGVLLAAACCAVQTRHVGLAALTAFVPLPGLILAAPLSGGAEFGPVPFVAYALGFAVAALQAQATVDRVLACRSEGPWRSAAATAGFMIVLGALWFWGTEARDGAIQSVADMVLSALSAMLLLPVGAALIHFDESFVARANRVRERRQRIVERIALVTTPRWALSVAGIAVVLLALGGFESVPAMRSGGAALALRGVSVTVVVVGAGIFARSWRDGLAAGLTCSVVALVSLWFTVYGRLDTHGTVCVFQSASLALLVALAGLRRAVVCTARGDAKSVARQRSVEDMTVGQTFAGMGAVMALLPAVATWPGYVPFAAGLAVAAVGGVLFMPAIATALETVFPPHHSAEELYGARRKYKARA